MGCHTWFYKKSSLTLEQAKEKLIKRQQKIIDEYKNMKFIDYAKLLVDFPYMYDSKERLIELYQRRIKRIQNPNIKEETIYFHLDEGDYIEGKGYYTDAGFHDLFRIGGYPEVCLFSLDQTLEYIKIYEKKYNCKIDVMMDLLQEFWNKYPDGMINFG